MLQRPDVYEILVANRHAGAPSIESLCVLHAILTPRIRGRFMACNTALRAETWRTFYIARHVNAP